MISSTESFIKTRQGMQKMASYKGIKNLIIYHSHQLILQITSDEIEGNSGFYLVRSTAAGVRLHSQALQHASSHPELSNQKTLAAMLDRDPRINSLTLLSKHFPNGYQYYEVNTVY